MNRGTAGQFAGEMLMRGTTRHTRQQIQDEFDKLKARVSVSPGPNSVSASIETVRDNLPAVKNNNVSLNPLRAPSSIDISTLFRRVTYATLRLLRRILLISTQQSSRTSRSFMLTSMVDRTVRWQWLAISTRRK